MALSALQIYKYLPKTNCKDCGDPTCLAFAMKLAASKADIAKCPHISDEGKDVLGAASRPPIKPITVGNVKLGDETCMFRHEKKFFNQTAIAVRVNNAEDIELCKKTMFERVGEELRIDILVVSSKDRDIVKKASESNFEIMIEAEDAESLKKALDAAGKKCIITNISDKMLELTKGHAVVLSSEIDDVEENVKKVKAVNEDIILELVYKNLRDMNEKFTIARRLAIKKKDESFGYPLIAFTKDFTESSVAMMKYASIIVLEKLDENEILPLLTLRQNIYSDPQKPTQMEAMIYEVGKPNENSPVILTTNFSLTYFSVSGDADSSKIPCWVMVPDTEGMSVLTAWAAGKLEADTVAKFIKSSGIEDKVKHRNLIIPGLVAVLSGEIEDLSKWKVLVGPKDSSKLPKFLKEHAHNTI